MDFEPALQEALADITAQLPANALGLMQQHWQLVQSWNSRTNLTSIATNRAAAWLHYRDSLEALPFLTGGPIIDMGSGAGFPGLPLAIARPQWAFTLMEPRRKRASFLRTCVARLGLTNVAVQEGRSTDAPTGEFAACVTRATFSAPEDLLHCFAWLRPGGRLIAFRAGHEAVAASAVVHRYELLASQHALAIWTRAI